MQKGYKIIEKFNSTEKNAEEKLQEVFIKFLTEKLINTENIKDYTNLEKSLEKSDKTIYNHSSKRNLLLSERGK